MATAVEIAVKAVGTAAAGRAIGGLDSKTSRLGSTLKTVAKAGALAVGAAAVYGAKKLIDFTQAAIEDEAAQSKLAQTLKNTTGATDKQVASVEKWITRQGKLLGVTDDELRPALQRMAEGTKDVGKAQRMVSLAMDVSAGTGKSLKAVTEALLRAQNGSVGGLSRYGIATKDAKGETLSFNEVVKGMAKTFKGQAAVQANTLEGKMSRLKIVLSEAGESIGAKLIPLLSDLVPYLTDAANSVVRKVVPAMGDMADWFKRNKDEIGTTAASIKDGLLPPLQSLSGFAADAAKFLGGLPGPVQSLGVQAAAAALIVPRLMGALTAAKGAATGFATSVRTAGTRTAALGGMARNAAGIGGVLLLTQGMKKAGTVAGGLETTLGGAATGFAVGGPIGAGVGALAGLFLTLSHRTEDTTENARKLARQLQNVDPAKVAAKSLASLKGTLDQVSGAYTGATRAAVLHKLEENGMLAAGKAAGISARQMVNAALGMGNGLRRVTPAVKGVKDQIKDLHREQVAIATDPRNFTDTGLSEEATKNYNALQKQKNALRANIAELRQMPGALRSMGKETRAAYLATQDLTELQGKIRPKILTKIEATGIVPTARGVADVAKKYGLVPKEIKPIIKALGIDVTVAQVKRVRAQIEDTGRAKPDFGPARAAVDTFIAGFSNSLSGAQTRARTGGAGIGSALAAGMAGGIASNAWQAVNAAGAMVTQAITEANARADRHSPSRVTHALGADMAEGLARGMAAGNRRNKQAGKNAVNAIIKGFDEGSGGVAKVTERLANLISSTFAQRAAATRRRIKDATNERHALAALQRSENARTRQLRNLDDALVRNGKSQDRMNNRLQAAREKLKGLLDESKNYAKSIRDAVVATGDVTTLGKGEEGTATVAGILDQMRARLQAAQRFADLIRKLTAAGLNQTSLQQLLAAGVEGGLSTAEALSAGGSDVIKEVNTLTNQLTEAGTGLGDKAADTMYGAGIKTAQGLVDGLESQQKHLEKVARRLANTLARAVRQALKIHSPSGVFKDLGAQTVAGLRIGLDDTHVRTSGRKLATDLVAGFAEPRLTATAVLDAGAAGAGTVPTVRIELTAAQFDALARGRGITLDVDQFQAAGGRQVAKVVTKR